VVGGFSGAGGDGFEGGFEVGAEFEFSGREGTQAVGSAFGSLAVKSELIAVLAV